MRYFIKNATLSVSVSLTALRFAGFWTPDGITGNQKFLYKFYTLFSFMFLLGTYLIIQVVDLFLIWGDLALMTGTAFLLFTNLAHAAKIINILYRRTRILAILEEADAVLMSVETEKGKDIVRRCDRETRFQQLMYLFLTSITGIGWACSAEKGQLPLRAWLVNVIRPEDYLIVFTRILGIEIHNFKDLIHVLSSKTCIEDLRRYPYDTSKSPAYELTYIHQVGALFIAAYLNVGKDSLVSALIAQCRCRLRLLRLSLATLCDELQPAITGESLLTPDQEKVVSARLRNCVVEHQATLAAATQLQACFSEPTFAQFTVSLIIICVTAFQLVSQTGNLVRLLSMATYLLNMTFQVFIYCYQGNQLSEESSEIAGAVYTCPWYLCSVRLRRALLIVMVRTRRLAKITAGSFTTLSLFSFMAIIKASYSLFTLLQQVNENE